MEAFESEVLDLPDFCFTGDDYRYPFDIEAMRRFIGFLREQFNSGANYESRVLKWGTVIEQKVTELRRFLIRKSSSLDFTEPSPKLLGYDARKLRRRILSLTQFEARALGIGKSTLHYLRNRAQESPNFKSYQKTFSRLDLVG